MAIATLHRYHPRLRESRNVHAGDTTWEVREERASEREREQEREREERISP